MTVTWLGYKGFFCISTKKKTSSFFQLSNRFLFISDCIVISRRRCQQRWNPFKGSWFCRLFDGRLLPEKNARFWRWRRWWRRGRRCQEWWIGRWRTRTARIDRKGQRLQWRSEKWKHELEETAAASSPSTNQFTLPTTHSFTTESEDCSFQVVIKKPS